MDEKRRISLYSTKTNVTIFGHKLSSTSLKYTTAHTCTFIIPGNRTGHHTEFQTSLSKYEKKNYN